MSNYISPVRLCAILLVTCNVSFAILAGPSQTGGNGNNSKSETGKPAADEAESASSNTTFYYEANEFLKNPKESKKSAQANETSRHEFKPASVAMTSGRNGRMMDLDALMGDFAASQANRKQSGQRQSRYIPSDNLSLAAAGKKLHIQGFIPIVGVKDVVGNEDEEAAESNAAEQAAAAKQKLRAMQNLNTGSELPYAQSSMGHASYGVQRYLSSEQPQFANLLQDPGQQVDSKSSSIMESLKRPIKKIAGFAGAPSDGQPQGQQQNCLCVPFYMCKNGFIVESSLGRSQIQQMVLQQQQQQQLMVSNQQFANQQQIEMKSGQLIAPPARAPVGQPAAAYGADSYAQVDERSLDKDIITMAPLVSASAAFVDQNQTAEFGESAAEQQATPALNQTQLDELSSLMAGNSSAELNSEYSQEILGRMLGLKSKASAAPNPLQRQQQPAAVGACGLLRTCCGIPAGALAPQVQPEPAVNYQPAVGYASAVNLRQSALQRYQPARAPINQQTVYGLPSQAQISRAPPPQQLSMQLASSYASPSGEPLPPLGHRTSQLASRFQPPSMVAQYARANPTLQLLQQKAVNQYSIQQQQQQQQQSFPVSAARQNSALQPANSLLGSRKILDGRCGLRQSVGITGRVQNLQYPESSADFGEYPAQAAILKRLGSSDSLFVCGGTLISQYWVATAAHCIKKHSQSDLKVRLGEWDVHRDDEFYPFVEKEIRDVIVHPEFVAGNLVNDIALLRLDSPVDISLPHVNPACLPTIDESFARQHCWVTGWGKDSFGQKGSFQAVLKEVELPVVGQGECEQALRSTRLGPHYRLHSGFICAGGENGKDACEGDGGSGLYCVQDGVVKVAGLVSWGIGCGQAGVPGVYVNMAHYRPWIENIISIDEDIYSPQSNLVGSSSLISERNNNNNNFADNSTVLLPEVGANSTASK